MLRNPARVAGRSGSARQVEPPPEPPQPAKPSATAPLASEVRHLEPAHVAVRTLRAQLRIAIAARAPKLLHRGAQRVIGFARAQHSAQITANAGEQAPVNVPICAQAQARAVPEKGLGNAGNHANFPAAVAVPEALGHFTGIVWRHRLERKLSVNQRSNLFAADHFSW